MGKTAEQRNPATGESLGSVQVQDVAVVRRAVEAARVAQKKWAALSYRERASHLKKMKRFLVDNAERAAEIVSKSSGKLYIDAMTTEVMPSVLSCDWYASNTQKVLKPTRIPTGSIAFGNKSNTLTYEPLGVVGIISPWNYPLSIPFGEVVMALMAGNAVVLKVATNSALVGQFIEECMKAGELPEDLFCHLIIPGAEAGTGFLDAGVDKLFFTGSVEVGKKLMAHAARTLTPVSLELGGNDPMVVLDDASVERAVNCACWAGYQNAGQSCGGVERIYVHASLYDEFLDQLVAKTKALRHGPESGRFDVDVGSVTTKGQLDTIGTQVEEAVAAGAKIAAQSQPVGDCSKGFFFPATVLTGCTPEMRVVKEETFGPVLPVMRFEDEEEVLRLANNCNLALTSSVFSTNSKRAWAFAERLESGVVSVNDHLYSHGMAEAPWGGWKESGIGRTHGVLGLREMTNVKCINTDCLPSGLAPRNLWWYPFSPSTFNALRAALHLLAPKSVGEFFSSLKGVLANSTIMFKKWKVDSVQ